MSEDAQGCSHACSVRQSLPSSHRGRFFLGSGGCAGKISRLRMLWTWGESRVLEGPIPQLGAQSRHPAVASGLSHQPCATPTSPPASSNRSPSLCPRPRLRSLGYSVSFPFSMCVPDVVLSEKLVYSARVSSGLRIMFIRSERAQLVSI